MDLLEIAKGNSIRVDLKQIDENPGPYCMSFGFDLKPLTRSVEEFGLINSPIVTKDSKGRVEVVAGYRRILALKQLQWEEVPCRDLYDAGISSLQLLLLNLHDNLATRQFNEVEKGMILNRLIPHVSRDEILRNFMPLLDLPSHEPTLEIFSRLEQLDRRMKESLVNAHISFQTAKALIEMDPESRSILFQWIAGLKLNANQQSQFMAYAMDISIRDQKKTSELLQEDGFLDILDDKNMNNPQKSKSILNLLKSRRFPSLTRSEKTFQEKSANLELPEGIHISHPPFFEGSDYRLEILFKDGERLKEKIDALRKVSGLETLADPWLEGDV